MNRLSLSFVALILAVCLTACSNARPSDASEYISDTVYVSDTADLPSGDKTDAPKEPGGQQPNDLSSSSQDNKPPLDKNCAIAVNGVSLSYYSVVYNADDIYAAFAAENLKAYLKGKFKIELSLCNDQTPSQDYEIVLGNTSRSLSVANEASLTGEKYALRAEGGKIILKANGYMIGGAVCGFLDICESAPKQNNILSATISEKTVTKEYTYKPAKNILLYIGDGLGFNHIEWAINDGVIPKFYAADLPNKGEAVTYSLSVSIAGTAYTDSAAAATALATGYKTMNGYLGVDRYERSLKNIRELASEKGAKTAILTTDAITGATPSAFLVHIPDREQTEAIKSDIDKLVSGGKVSVAFEKLGDTLYYRSKDTLDQISADDGRFFMMLEEAYIDKSSHNSDKYGMQNALNRFNTSVAYAMEFTLIRGDTVLIVTADHETGGVQNSNGFGFTTTNHTNANVPLFVMGNGAEELVKKPLNNVLIPRFLAKIYGDNSFGDMTITE